MRISLRPVEENIAEMDNFVHNAGHELKTPISVVSSNLQLMKQLKQSDNTQMIEENIAELTHMDKLIEALVTFTDLGENTKISQNSI
ncbi:MAG: histidine kinase dimerization/phospho-acceptor domain-containing protein [Patescibacteria group bacterium]